MRMSAREHRDEVQPGVLILRSNHLDYVEKVSLVGPWSSPGRLEWRASWLQGSLVTSSPVLGTLVCLMPSFSRGQWGLHLGLTFVLKTGSYYIGLAVLELTM